MAINKSVIFVNNEYINGKEEFGRNTEYYNIYLSLKEIFSQVSLFDYFTEKERLGREKMNEELLQTVKKEKPDLVIILLCSDDFEADVLDQIKAQTTSIFYAYDDMWRTDFVARWAPHFTYMTTSYIKGGEYLKKIGIHNAVYLSLGCNHLAYPKTDTAKEYEVSFIGSYHPHRAWLVKWLRRAGIDVYACGWGWDGTKKLVSHEEKVKIINASKINLNLNNEVCWDMRYMLSSPRAFINTFRSDKTYAPINVRIFEINSCGGFQVLPYMEGLEQRYKIGEELIVFDRPEQLVEQVKYYLKNDSERDAIALQGYERTLAEHTMERRFNEMLESLELPQIPAKNKTQES